MKLNNNLLLIIGAVLIGYSLFGSNINIRNENADLQLNKPSEVLLQLSQPVIDSIKNQSSESNKDGVILANLYNDIATLIELDDTIIKNTEEIREANKLSGSMLRLNIKDKYPEFPQAATNLIVKYIGDDNIALSQDLRQKSVEAFRALAWACNEGSK
jgi:hypothetical protein